MNRHDLGYREAGDDAPERCQTCRHLGDVVLPDRLGECNLFAILHQQQPERWHLYPDVGMHMRCDAWEGAAKMAEEEKPEGPAPAGDQLAMAGQDGKRAEELLRKAKEDGRQVLASITERALKRLLNGGPENIRKRKQLFNSSEKGELAKVLASTRATAELLGRARIRLRKQRAEKFAEQDFDDDAHPFEQFDEAAGIKPLAPENAVDYFKRLFPSLDVEPKRFGWEHRRDAFTLANQTDQTLLEKIQGIIAQALETGQKVSAAPSAIQAILDAAGVAPKNPQYSEMLVRTNMHDAYLVGSDQERMKPDVIETFPVWRYIGIRDGRQGKDHEAHFDRYYPAHKSFAEVRGPRVFNCRCDSVPISKWQWAKLERQGARLA